MNLHGLEIKIYVLVLKGLCNDFNAPLIIGRDAYMMGC